MKILEVTVNNHKKEFQVRAANFSYAFPFARTLPQPTATNPIVGTLIDDELGRQGFVYCLASGEEGTILWDQVLDYNSDPDYLRDLLLYKLTVKARDRLQESPLSKREIIRRLGTSASQFYRLLDTTNTSKTIDRMLALLHVLDCEVDLVVRDVNR